jgi:antitoxin VapB
MSRGDRRLPVRREPPICSRRTTKFAPYIPVVYSPEIMTHSTVLKSNKSQAMRLPKAVVLPDHVKRVAIVKQGSGRLIVPAGESWDAFFAGPRIDADFLSDRRQPRPQRRADP